MSSEPLNFCIICANIYCSPDFVPITFQCGHTYCSTCVQKKHHYKTFGHSDGLCVIDRTQVLAGQQGRVNKALLQYLSFYQNEVKSSIRLISQLEQTQTKNEKLTDTIDVLQDRFVQLEQQKQQWQEKYKQVKRKSKPTIDYQFYKKQQKLLKTKLQTLTKINQIKQARKNQLKYLIDQLKVQNN